MILLFWFILAIGQADLGCGLHPALKPSPTPGTCPEGLSPIGNGRWVAQGVIDKEKRSARFSAGPWPARDSQANTPAKGKVCAHCQVIFPLTCVADYQGTQTIETENGLLKVHVFTKAQWQAQ
jgi:hypothetical protein